MATAQQTADAMTGLVNSFQSMSNSVSAQLAEVTTVVADFADQLKNGNSPDPAILDTVVQQMTNVKGSQDAMNQQVQDSIAALQAADPGPVVVPPPPVVGPNLQPQAPRNPGDAPEVVSGSPTGTGEPNTPKFPE